MDYRRFTVFGLLLGLVAFGVTSSLEVFYPASFLAEDAPEHSHSHSDRAVFCGTLIPAPDHDCIHASTYLDIQDDQTSESVFDIEKLKKFYSVTYLASTFHSYHLRAPPLAPGL